MRKFLPLMYGMLAVVYLVRAEGALLLCTNYSQNTATNCREYRNPQSIPEVAKKLGENGYSVDGFIPDLVGPAIEVLNPVNVYKVKSKGQ